MFEKKNYACGFVVCIMKIGENLNLEKTTVAKQETNIKTKLSYIYVLSRYRNFS